MEAISGHRRLGKKNKRDMKLKVLKEDPFSPESFKKKKRGLIQAQEIV